MGLYNELFGNADKLLPSLWDMVSYPFGGGTNKADQAYYSAAMTQAHLPKANLYGNYTGIGPQVQSSIPLGTALLNNGIVPIAPAIKSVVNVANGASNLGSYVLLGLGAVVLLKILK